MTSQMPPAAEALQTPPVADEESRTVGSKRQYITPRRALELRLEHAFRQLRRAGVLAETREPSQDAPISITIRCGECSQPQALDRRFSGDGYRVALAARIKAVVHVKLRHPEAFAAVTAQGGAR